jgi:2-amino-4-hydroxy-6-hydroxymethyldihydropteridine diphosphokinase
LLLGSNIEAAVNLPRALALLAGAGTVVAVSGVYRTAAVGRTDLADFLNAAALLETALGAGELKERAIAGVEAALGRVRDPLDKNAPRTIDVDVAIWESSMPGPPADPDIVQRAHVAVPLADLAPDWVHPADGRPLALIAAELIAAEIAAGRVPPARLPAPLPGWSVP